MIRKINLHHIKEAIRVLDLQNVSYRVEAKIIGLEDIPPLNETIETLQQSNETFYGYFSGEQLLGAISYKKTDRLLEICRLMVHPDHFRQGIAGSLLTFIEEQEVGIDKITVMTGEKNKPAKKLYQRHGFVRSAKREVTPGLMMISFEKTISVR